MKPRRQQFSIALIVLAAGAMVFSQARDTTDAAENNRLLVQMERDWADALVKGDVATLERIYGSDYTAVDPSGRLLSRAEEIAEVKAGIFKPASMTNEEVQVRLYGGGTAVVTGRSIMTGRTSKGQDISGQYRFTDTFIKEGAQWRVIATQATKISSQLP